MSDPQPRPPADPPQPNAVLAEPATPEACAADWDDRGHTPMHPSSYDAGFHTANRPN